MSKFSTTTDSEFLELARAWAGNIPVALLYQTILLFSRSLCDGQRLHHVFPAVRGQAWPDVEPILTNHLRESLMMRSRAILMSVLVVHHALTTTYPDDGKLRLEDVDFPIGAHVTLVPCKLCKDVAEDREDEMGAGQGECGVVFRLGEHIGNLLSKGRVGPPSVKSPDALPDTLDTFQDTLDTLDALPDALPDTLDTVPTQTEPPPMSDDEIDFWANAGGDLTTANAELSSHLPSWNDTLQNFELDGTLANVELHPAFDRLQQQQGTAMDEGNTGAVVIGTAAASQTMDAQGESQQPVALGTDDGLRYTQEEWEETIDNLAQEHDAPMDEEGAGAVVTGPTAEPQTIDTVGGSHQPIARETDEIPSLTEDQLEEIFAPF